MPTDDLPTLHARNVADTNAQLAAAGRCVLHNTDAHIPARYLVELPIGNILPLCLGCCAQWRTDADQTGDPAMQPVRITDLDLDLDTDPS